MILELTSESNKFLVLNDFGMDYLSFVVIDVFPWSLNVGNCNLLFTVMNSPCCITVSTVLVHCYHVLTVVFHFSHCLLCIVIGIIVNIVTIFSKSLDNENGNGCNTNTSMTQTSLKKMTK